MYTKLCLHVDHTCSYSLFNFCSKWVEQKIQKGTNDWGIEYIIFAKTFLRFSGEGLYGDSVHGALKSKLFPQ